MLQLNHALLGDYYKLLSIAYQDYLDPNQSYHLHVNILIHLIFDFAYFC